MQGKKDTIFEQTSLYHIGIVVKSVDKSVRFYTETFGIGPFEVREVNFQTASFFGKKGGYRGKRAFAKLGQITLELIEHIEGKTIHEVFLKQKGEGLHHLGFGFFWRNLLKSSRQYDVLHL